MFLNNVYFNFTTPIRSTHLRIMGGFHESPISRTVDHQNVRKSIRESLLYATEFKSDCENGNFDNIQLRTYNETHNQSTESNETCWKSQIAMPHSHSPYFEELYNDQNEVSKWFQANPNMDFSSTTESDFDMSNQPAIVIYIQPGKLYQNCLIFGGFLLLGVSFCLTIFIAKHSDQLFQPPNKDAQNGNNKVHGKMVESHELKHLNKVH